MSQSTFELRDKVVRAGAGAGKTTRLTQEVIDVAQHFLKHHNRLPKLVVTTFTRKATQELRERLILKVCEDQNMELLDYVSSSGQLHISTIHGVLGLFLRRYGHLFDIDNGFKIIGGSEAQNIKRRVLREILFSQPTGLKLLESYSFTNLLAIFNKYSKAAVQSPNLKSYSMDGLAQLYGRSLKNILGPLIQVVAEVEAETSEASWINFVQKVGTWAHISRETPLKSGADLLQAYKEIGRKPSFKAEKTSLSERTHEQLKSLLTNVKKELANEAYEMSHWEPMLKVHSQIEVLAQEFSDKFIQDKKQRGLLEMDDLELFALEAIRKEPEVAKEFSNEWDYWLIDEYQDTSPLQVEILKKLSGEQPKFIVGDPQQSIYLFRGARSEVFENQQNELTARGYKVDELLKNYRSEPELLCFMNDFFSQLGDQFKSMEPRSSESFDAKKVVATMLSFEKEEPLSAEDSKNDKADAKEHSDAESRAIAAHILQLREKGSAWDEICVLGRTNSVLRQLIPILRRRGIPAHIHASSGFSEKQEVRDALSLLKFLVHQKDNENLMSLLRSPWSRILDDELIELLKEKPNFYWEHFCKQINLLSPASQRVIKKLQMWLEICKVKGIVQCLQRALREIGLLDYSYYYDSSGQREANIWKLILRLEDQSRRPDFNFLDFVSDQNAELSEEAQDDNKEAVAALEPDRVNLMTIHSSKGLQFNHVILPKMGSRPRMASHSPHASLFHWDEAINRWSCPVPLGKELKLTSSPGDRSILKQMDQRELEESDRLLYVALTRAKATLFLSWTKEVAKNSWVDRLGWQDGVNWEPKRKNSSEQNYQICLTASFAEVSKTCSTLLDHEKLPRDLLQQKRLGLGDRHLSVTSVIQWLDGSDWKSFLKASKADINFGTKPIVIEEDKTVPSAEGNASKNSELQLTPIKSPELLLKQFYANQRGSLLHRLFEVMAKSPEVDLLRLSHNWFGDEQAVVAEAIEYVKNCSTPPLMELQKWGKSEWGFQLRTVQGILEGQVDLWGQLWRDDEGRYHPRKNDNDENAIEMSLETWIIDYKSGSDRYINDALTQLNIYGWALRQYGVEGPIKLAVVYPLSQKKHILEFVDE